MLEVLSVPSSFRLQRSPSSQASVPSSYLLNSCAGVQLHDVVLKSWGEMLYKDCDTFFYCDQGYKMSQSNPGGRLAVEDGESLRAWACGCNITRESKSEEVKMLQTWVYEQVAFGYRWSNNDLYSKNSYSGILMLVSELTLDFFKLWLVRQMKWM